MTLTGLASITTHSTGVFCAATASRTRVFQVVRVVEHHIGIEAIEQEPCNRLGVGIVGNTVESLLPFHLSQNRIIGPRPYRQQPNQGQGYRQQDPRQHAEHQHAQGGAH